MDHATKINNGVEIVCGGNCDFCPIVGDNRFFPKNELNKQEIKEPHVDINGGYYSSNFLKTIENGGRTS